MRGFPLFCSTLLRGSTKKKITHCLYELQVLEIIYHVSNIHIEIIIRKTSNSVRGYYEYFTFLGADIIRGMKYFFSVIHKTSYLFHFHTFFRFLC